MEISNHANQRVQQRGIPPVIVDWLLKFGAVEHTHGARKLFFDRAARKRLSKTIGAQVVDRLGDLLNVYIVVSEEARVVTAGHRFERIKRR